MTSIDFVVSNPGHHWSMVQPVARLLGDRGHSCRILSLCELRGTRTPDGPTAEPGPKVVRIVQRAGRELPGRSQMGAASSLRRRLARPLAWRVLVEPGVRRALSAGVPAAVAVPHDTAYPYRQLVQLLQRSAVKVVLFQEGMLSPLPDRAPLGSCGSGRTDAIAAWGQASADYFLSVGAAAGAIHVTGSPRHEGLTRSVFEEEADRIRSGLGDGRPLLVLMTNPIDRLGYCSAAHKMSIVTRFLAALAPLVEKDRLRLVVKPHGGEPADAYQAAIDAAGVASGTRLVSGGAPYPMLVAADAVVTMGSTVGLEALLLGSRLGVLAVPGRGYIHDFVECRVGTPIDPENPTGIPATIASMLAEPLDGRAVEAYLDRHLAHRTTASQRVADVILSAAG